MENEKLKYLLGLGIRSKALIRQIAWSMRQAGNSNWSVSFQNKLQRKKKGKNTTEKINEDFDLFLLINNCLFLLQEAVNRVKSQLAKIRHMQEAVRAFEARDRNIAEGNYVRVNWWSFIQIVVMLVVGFVQVLFLLCFVD